MGKSLEGSEGDEVERGRPPRPQPVCATGEKPKHLDTPPPQKHPLYLGEGLAPALVEPPQLALHLPQRLAPLRLRLGVDEVPEPLGRRQVQFAAVESSPSEFARLGGAQPGQAPCHGANG